MDERSLPVTDSIEVKVTHRFAATPERVYDALLDPQKARLWQQGWMAQTGSPGTIITSEIDPVVGGRFQFGGRGEDGVEAHSWGRYRRLGRPNLVEFAWIVDPAEEDNPSVVTVIIEPEPEGTGSVVTLYNPMGAEWAEYRERTERAWMAMLSAVDAVLRAEGPAA